LAAVTPRKPYQLEPVLRHRKQRVEDQSRELADKVRASELAAHERLRTEADHQAHAEEVREVEAAERGLLEGGALRAGDLQRQQAYETAQAEVARALQQRTEAARSLENGARQSEQRSRAAVQHAQADAEVLLRHRDAFVREADRREQEAAEEEAQEAHNARRSRGGT
jgi:hypothetical protein